MYYAFCWNYTIYICEGLVFLKLINYSSLLKDTSEEFLKTKYADIEPLLKRLTNSQDSKKITRLTEQVKQHYFLDEPFIKESIPSFIRWLSDLWFSIPIKNFVNDRRKKKQAPIYYYSFSYVGNEMTVTKLSLNNLPMIGKCTIYKFSRLVKIKSSLIV